MLTVQPIPSPINRRKKGSFTIDHLTNALTAVVLDGSNRRVSKKALPATLEQVIFCIPSWSKSRSLVIHRLSYRQTQSTSRTIIIVIGPDSSFKHPFLLRCISLAPWKPITTIIAPIIRPGYLEKEKKSSCKTVRVKI